LENQEELFDEENVPTSKSVRINCPNKVVEIHKNKNDFEIIEKEIY
jgi:hypothetical protein